MNDSRIPPVLVWLLAVVALSGGGCTPAPETDSPDGGVTIDLAVSDDAGPAAVIVSGLAEATVAALENAELGPDEWGEILSVTVRDPDVAAQDLPAVLGSYGVDGPGVIRFEPGPRHRGDRDGVTA